LFDFVEVVVASSGLINFDDLRENRVAHGESLFAAVSDEPVFLDMAVARS
jgi:hypothetical protein